MDNENSIISRNSDKNVGVDRQFTNDLIYRMPDHLNNGDFSRDMKGSTANSTSELITDPWAIGETKTFGVPWKELNLKEKCHRIGIGIAKGIGLLCLLYFFVCSLDLLSLGFRIVGGRTTGKIFRQSEILQNPVVGVMVGILTTVLVQSSSTSTSIIVSMVAAEFLKVDVAIPIIMGANIGTSITNTIVSLTQVGDRDQFRRAFAGATVHDMFNWLTVITLLIVEVTTGYLFKITSIIMDKLVDENGTSGGEVEVLGKITKPFVNLIVQVDSEVLNCWGTEGCDKHDNSSLIKVLCKVKGHIKNGPKMITHQDFELNFAEKITTALSVFADETTTVGSLKEQCKFLFHGTNMSDEAAGAIILVVALTVLCLCLILIVKVLNSVLQGQIAIIIKKTLNAKIPYVPWITGYLAMVVGAVMTFLVQSSSVFTSALTPLVGLGVLTLERVYPLTLGSNIGTTTTALLAAMAATGKSFKPSMQIALCHLLFNVTGIVIFYPIPFLRLPILLAKFLGDTTAKYRWFAIVYMVLMFIIVPGLFMALSFAGSIYVIVVASILCAMFLFIAGVNFIRKKKPSLLPGFLKSWKWLPIWFRSLEPYDTIFSKMSCVKKFKNKNKGGDDVNGVLKGSHILRTEQLPDSGGQFTRVTTDGDGGGNVNEGFEGT